MKLEPTEAQREAMIRYVDGYYEDPSSNASTASYVDGLITAANSIPEGAPVGTIARRPDGFWIAHMTESGWEYTELVTGTWRGSDADSWPVIYDPTSEKTREEKIQDYLEWSETQVDTDALDPIAQQEPGESLARGLDDIAAGRVSRRDDYLEPEDPEYCGNCDGRKCMGCVFREYDHDCADDCPDCCTTARTPRVVDRQQEPALRERFPEQASAYVADPELAEVDDEPLPSGSLITPKPRTPRVGDPS